MCDEIDAKGTQISIILNNAGLQIAYRTDYLTTPAEDYDISFRFNTTSPMLICYHFLPGILVGAFIDDGKSGRTFAAQEFSGMTLEEAVAKAHLQPGVYD